MKRSYFIAAGVFALAVAVGLWLAAPGAPSKIPLPGDGEMRVLKVSLGTNHVLSLEPVWKQCVRRVLPEALQKPLGPFQGERTTTRWDTLVVWLEATSPSYLTSFALTKPEAIFTNNISEPGKVQSKNGLLRLSFTCFQRESAVVPLKVLYNETNWVLFYVSNPKPAKVASWNSLPLPQTQEVNNAHVILSSLRTETSRKDGKIEYKPAVHIRGSKSPGHYVLYWWRVTAFDQWGNCKEGGYNGREGARFAPLPTRNSPWRIRLEGEEYLSARMVPFPTNELALALSPTPRMQELGIRSLMWVGPGVHTIADGVPGPVRSSYEAGGSGISSFLVDNGGVWSLQLITRLPGVICVSEMLPNVPRPRMRMHERNEHAEGRITVGKALFSATNSVGNITRLAQFFEAKVPSVFTNRWEVEMISDIAAEFVIEPPAQSPAKDPARAGEPLPN